MNQDYYNKIVLPKFEPIYHMLLPFFSITMILVAVLNLINNPNYFYVIFGVFTAMAFAASYLLRHKFSTALLMNFGNSIFMLIAFILILNNGIKVNNIIILLAVTISSVIFLPKRFSYTYMLMTFVFFVIAPFISKVKLTQIDMPAYISTVLGYLIVLLIMHLSYNHLAKILIDIIMKLENQIQLTDEKTEQLNLLAYFDQLTGLPNKELFKIQISPLINEGRGFLVILDIRDFRIINSLQGNTIGENILKKIGYELSLIQDDATKCARIGGNEFGLYFNLLGEQEIVEFTLSKLDNFNEKYHNILGFKKIKFYIAVIPTLKENETYESLFQKGMLTLRNCKNNQQYQYLVYNEKMLTQANEIENILSILETEIQNRGFEVHYQEKISSVNGTVTGLEALARLKISGAGYISPGIFIPIVEKLNLTVQFGTLIIQKVLQDIPRIIALYGPSIQVSINISPTHLLSDGFVEYLITLNEERSINKNILILEITEEVFVADYTEIKLILEKLQSIGFKISLDDFGSGYSSLSYISELPLNEIKIDRSFTQKVTSNKKTELMMKVIFDMAGILGYKLVVEGVETEDEVNLIKSMGICDIQGYFYSKPKLL